MKADLQLVFKFMHIIQTNKRISVRKVADELEMSPRRVYRWIEAASVTLPIRLENGVIVNISTI